MGRMGPIKQYHLCRITHKHTGDKVTYCRFIQAMKQIVYINSKIIRNRIGLIIRVVHPCFTYVLRKTLL